ncbi:DNA polymerase III subunit delta' [Chthonobacter albigriseus]|uniref:DNA polymerase III subunit delta' n=1 Tax=Chthonobacter albigriseus TaxID=1683161 RepID=UPI0015EF5FEE|nr:DNA polymerase III subunit delta' [Chthonobacter albigriseus]
MAEIVDHTFEADWLEGLPLPREQTALHGHANAARTLHEAYRSGRMHHAWLMTGPKGIGKATLAFRFARFALSHPDPTKAPPAEGEPLTPVDPRVAAQIAAGAHPNLLHLRRPWDEDKKKLKTLLTVDEVRRAGAFFGTSAGGRGYRIAIVDAADEMNPNAANALLKMLEEPPPRAMFLVLSHAPGRLLPTIRSRCRRLNLEPLGDQDLLAALDTLNVAVDADVRAALAAIAEGSVRRAAECLEGEGLALHAAFVQVVNGLPRLDRRALHRFAELAGGRRGDDSLSLVADFARQWLADAMRAKAPEGAGAVAGYAEAWDAVNRIIAETDGLNLDRKQAAIGLMEALARAAERG